MSRQSNKNIKNNNPGEVLSGAEYDNFMNLTAPGSAPPTAEDGYEEDYEIEDQFYLTQEELDAVRAQASENEYLKSVVRDCQLRLAQLETSLNPQIQSSPLAQPPTVAPSTPTVAVEQESVTVSKSADEQSSPLSRIRDGLLLSDSDQNIETDKLYNFKENYLEAIRKGEKVSLEEFFSPKWIILLESKFRSKYPEKQLFNIAQVDAESFFSHLEETLIRSHQLFPSPKKVAPAPADQSVVEEMEEPKKKNEELVNLALQEYAGRAPLELSLKVVDNFYAGSLAILEKFGYSQYSDMQAYCDSKESEKVTAIVMRRLENSEDETHKAFYLSVLKDVNANIAASPDSSSVSLLTLSKFVELLHRIYDSKFDLCIKLSRDEGITPALYSLVTTGAAPASAEEPSYRHSSLITELVHYYRLLGISDEILGLFLITTSILIFFFLCIKLLNC